MTENLVVLIRISSRHEDDLEPFSGGPKLFSGIHGNTDFLKMKKYSLKIKGDCPLMNANQVGSWQKSTTVSDQNNIVNVCTNTIYLGSYWYMYMYIEDAGFEISADLDVALRT